jgi:hypothetical protein
VINASIAGHSLLSPMPVVSSAWTEENVTKSLMGCLCGSRVDPNLFVCVHQISWALRIALFGCFRLVFGFNFLPFKSLSIRIIIVIIVKCCFAVATKQRRLLCGRSPKHFNSLTSGIPSQQPIYIFCDRHFNLSVFGQSNRDSLIL